MSALLMVATGPARTAKRAVLSSVAALGLLLPTAAQEASRPDQVWTRSRRDASLTMVTGIVKENTLKKVVVTQNGRDKDFKGEVVARVQFNDVPPPYRDGRTLFDRGVWEEAAAKFRVARDDASARELVKAQARLWAAESLLRWGATDPTRFDEAVEEVRGFVSAHPEHRDLPRARMLEARALHLAGKPEEAAVVYRDVYSKFSGGAPTEGWSTLLCLQAGREAARALLAANDTLGAREVFTSLQSTVGPLVAGLEDGDPTAPELQSILDEATLGEGFAELAAGNHRPALTFFQGRAAQAGPGSSATLRFGTAMGLGEALLADGKVREAHLEFARVVALDHSDRDRVARANVRLAQCELQLSGDSDSRARARAALKAVSEEMGDTTWADDAREILKTL